VCAERPSARILAVASGHLREAALSSAVQSGAIGELVALDQDPASLEEVQRSSYSSRVRTVTASIGALLKGSVDLGTFDFIYAAGLYDYLPAPVARSLPLSLVGRLRSGGRLLLGNFAAGFGTHAFMEAFMEWRLIGRTHEDMARLFAGLPSSALRETRTFDDSGRYVVYASGQSA